MVKLVKMPIAAFFAALPAKGKGCDPCSTSLAYAISTGVKQKCPSNSHTQPPFSNKARLAAVQ